MLESFMSSAVHSSLVQGSQTQIDSGAASDSKQDLAAAFKRKSKKNYKCPCKYHSIEKSRQDVLI